MAVLSYKKYKITINPDSPKVQGLRVGDVVRRYFYDPAKGSVYNLMVVLSIGEDTVEGGKRAWFIGALLDGTNDAPQNGEPLDFVRVTNLFDENRLGALYMTASDGDAPYLDVVDGIGRNASLMWPQGLTASSKTSNDSLFAVSGDVVAEYADFEEGNNRVLHLTRGNGSGFAGITQAFYSHLVIPQIVLVAYKAKASSNIVAKLRFDSENKNLSETPDPIDVSVGTDWEYCLHALSINHGGKFLRTLTFDIGSAPSGTKVSIADFNVIKLSSLTDYAQASQIRIGKLEGIVDPVFGKLDSYGGYFKKLYASNAAHISGTLTAGDENGFGASFYAGKIHKNAFLNSLSPIIEEGTSVTISNVESPVRSGVVVKIFDNCRVKAQTEDWASRLKQTDSYVLSFWSQFSSPGQIYVQQNGSHIGVITASESDVGVWHRHQIVFKHRPHLDTSADLYFNLEAEYGTGNADGKSYFLFTAPQLEKGEKATQYQPTDDTIDSTNEDYGAWFDRGGIGGTIQNPLLKLNADGKGAIEARSNSFRLNQDGSGHLANKGISWDKQGNVTFGENVKLEWSNLDSTTKDEMVSKSVKIMGADVFMAMGCEDANMLFSPDYLTLRVEETGMNVGAVVRKWYYVYDGRDIPIEANISKDGTSLLVFPNEAYWDSNDATLTIKVVSTYNGVAYSGMKTLRKHFTDGYNVFIQSSNGTSFKNGDVETVLTAKVMYQGQEVDVEQVKGLFDYTWRKYVLPDLVNEDSAWLQERVERHDSVLRVVSHTEGADVYTCELTPKERSEYPYMFPISFNHDNQLTGGSPILQQMSDGTLPINFPFKFTKTQ